MIRMMEVLVERYQRPAKALSLLGCGLVAHLQAAVRARRGAQRRRPRLRRPDRRHRPAALGRPVPQRDRVRLQRHGPRDHPQQRLPDPGRGESGHRPVLRRAERALPPSSSEGGGQDSGARSASRPRSPRRTTARTRTTAEGPARVARPGGIGWWRRVRPGGHGQGAVRVGAKILPNRRAHLDGAAATSPACFRSSPERRFSRRRQLSPRIVTTGVVEEAVEQRGGDDGVAERVMMPPSLIAWSVAPGLPTGRSARRAA